MRNTRTISKRNIELKKRTVTFSSFRLLLILFLYLISGPLVTAQSLKTQDPLWLAPGRVSDKQLLTEGMPAIASYRQNITESQYNIEDPQPELPYVMDSAVYYIYPGICDSILEAKKVFSYDEYGNVKKIHWQCLPNTFDVFFISFYYEDSVFFEYDSKGNLISSSGYRFGGRGFEQESFVYNSEGLLTEYQLNSDLDYNLESHEYYAWGEKKKTLGETRNCRYLSNDECLDWMVNKYEILYDSAGNKLSMTLFGDDTTYYSYEYEFDVNGREIYYEETYLKAYSKNYVWRLTRDSLSNGVVQELFSKNYRYDNLTGNSFQWTFCRYNDSGQRISGEFYGWNYIDDTTELTIVDSLIYDENGRLSSIYAKGYGSVFSGDEYLETYKYDEAGNLLEWSQYNKTYMGEWKLYRKEKFYYSTLIVGVNDQHIQEEAITIYPVPAGDFITVKPNKIPAGFLNYFLYDICGNQLMSGVLDREGETVISVSELKAGAYFIRIYDGGNPGNITFGKFIKK